MSVAERLAKVVADHLDPLALAIGGSVATGAFGTGSDIGLYVDAKEIPGNVDRALVAREFGAETGAESGADVDIMYRTPGAIRDRLDSVLCRHEAILEHTTCFWHIVLTSKPVFDPSGRFADLRS